MLKDLVLGDDRLSLSVNGGAATYDYFWLRDNARDPVSYDSRSHQRELFTASVDPAIKPQNGWLDDGIWGGWSDGRMVGWPSSSRLESAFVLNTYYTMYCFLMPITQYWAGQ